MGQVVGRGRIHADAVPFINLEPDRVEKLWSHYKLHSDGFSLDPDSLQHALKVIFEDDDDLFEQKCRALFARLDTDKNNLIDALECLATLASASGMKPQRKLTFVFDLYDFSESGELLLDEATLLLKSTVAGLCKISLHETTPSLKEFEDLARLALKLQPSPDGKAVRDVVSTISRAQFVAYAVANPTISSWLHHYDDLTTPVAVPTDFGLQLPATSGEYDFYKRKGTFAERPGLHEDAPCLAKYAALTPKVPEGEEAPLPRTATDASLELDWVFGFGAPGSRGSASYCTGDDVAFHAAELAILRSSGEEGVGQKFVRAHDSTVTALAVSADGEVVATGQAGDARVVVWSSSSQSVLGVLKSHTGAISLLAFSEDGKLASIDTNGGLCVWDTSDMSRVASASLTVPALGLCWTQTGFVTTSEQGVLFWTFHKGKYVPRSGLNGPSEAYTGAVCLPSGDVLTTTGSGGFVVWRGRNFLRSVDGAHDDAIADLSLVSGETLVPLLATCEGTKVKIWRAEELEVIMQLDLTTIPAIGVATTVSLHKSGSKVLVGTSERELYELSALGEGALEPKEEEEEEGPKEEVPVGELLNTIAIGPSGSGITDFSSSATKVATLDADGIGRDGTVVVVDLEAKAIVGREVVIGATSCCLSPDGSQVLVGKADGSGLVLSVADGIMTQAGVLAPPEPEPEPAPEPVEGEEGEEPAEPAEPPTVAPISAAQVCRWAEGTLALACGATVYLYGPDYSPKGSATLSADITSMDFKADGSVLMVATADLDLSFISAEDGATLPDRKGRNGTFPTVSLSYGFRGVLASLPHSGIDDPLCYAASGNLCAVGNRFGSIDLLPYPCTEKSAFVSVSGHGPGIAGMAFYGEDGFVSAGLSDGCLLVWRVESEDVEDDAPPPDEEEEEEDLGFAKYDSTRDAHLVESVEELTARIEAIRRNDAKALYALEDIEGEDPTQAWRDAVVPGKGSSASVVPVDDLALEWVHGYAGQSMRGNARYSSTGEVVYPAASFGLVLDKTPVAERMVRSQKVMANHSGQITALTTWGDLCATSANSSVLVWSSADVTGVQGFSLLHAGCSSLAFSQDGKYLAAASGGTLHVFGLGANQGLVAAASTGRDKILDLAFAKDSRTIVYGASDGFGVGTFQGCDLKVKRGLFGGTKRQAVFCGAFVSNGDDEKCLVGTQSGSIFTLEGRKLAEENHSHQGGPCYTMWSTSSEEGESDLDGVVLVTGGYDGKVKLFSYDMELVLEFDARRHSIDGSVSSACLNRDRRKVLVGTAGSEIFEFATNDESDLNKGALVSGHCAGSLRAVACHPILPEVATVGDDGYLRTWSLSSHKQLRKLDVGDASRALGFLPNGHEIGVGLGIEGEDSTDSGKVLIVSMLKPSLEIAKELKDANGAVTCISFSPDGEGMAVGSADSNIYVYDTLNSFILKCTCEGHADVPRTLDYSSDSLRIMSTSQNEMRCHDARNGDLKGYDATMEISDYDEWTAPLGWPVLGCYPAHAAATDITSVCKSSDSRLLATADASGLVSLYRWPCNQQIPCKTYKGHGGAVSMCRFTPDGAYLASVGSDDRCLLQWVRRKNGSCVKSRGALSTVKMNDVPPVPDYIEPEDPSSMEASALIAPSTAPQLQFCYGVPPQLNRVGYSTHGDIIMGLGSKGVVYDKASHTMRFFSSQNLVSAFACSGPYGAVAEVGNRVHVFDAETGRHCGSLQASLKAVSHLVFSSDGSTLVGVGTGLQNLLTVATWASMSGRWEDGVACAASPLPLTSMGFACWGGPSNLCVGGVGDTDAPDILFCDVSGKNISQRKTQSLRFAAYTAGGSVDDTILAGTPSGSLEVWAGSSEVKRTHTCDAHAGGVTCITSNMSAGRDGWVKVWSSDLECLRSYFVGTAGISSLAVSLTKIATVCDGSLVEIVADSGCASTLLSGDGAGQCGLDEKDGTLCITGDGGFVRLWSSATRQLKTAFSLTGFASRACAFAPGESTHLAIGIGSGAPSLDVDGKFYVFDVVPEGHIVKIAEGHHAKAYVTCAAYSPDGQTLALGAADHVIYLHGVNGNTPYELFAIFDKHEAPLRCLDFSADSSLIRAVDTTNVLKSCKSASGDEAPLRDIAWSTQRCPVGALVAGLRDESDPPVACAVNDGTVVSASHFGSVSARVWPATDAASAPATRGHGGPCASIVYASTVASAGAFDGCVLQWNVAPATAPPPPPPDPVVVTEVEPEEEDAPADE